MSLLNFFYPPFGDNLWEVPGKLKLSMTLGHLASRHFY